MLRRYTWLVGCLALAAGNARAVPEAADSDDAATGVGLASALLETRSSHAQPQPAPPNRLGAVLDNSFYLAVGGIWYVLDDANKPDRIFPVSLSTLEKKLVTREAFRFDENRFGLASPGHATSGMLYYLAGRSHGWGTIESAALSTVVSTLWELGIEFREVLSINDLVITPAGGFAFGEAAYQIGEYFRRSSQTPAHRVLATVLSGPSPLLPWYGGRRDLRTHERDAHGHPADMWGRVRATVGGDLMRGPAARSESAAFLGFEARVFELDDYAKAGTTEPLWLERSVGATAQVRWAVAPSGVEELWIATEAPFAAMRGRDLVETPGGLSGVEWLVGPSALYEHRTLAEDRGGERLGAVGPLGGAGHLSFHSGALQLRVDVSVHPVFAATDSRSWRTKAGCDPTAVATYEPRLLAKHCYYFGLGARLAASVDAEWHGWRAGAWVSSYGLSSAEWLQVPSQASQMALEDERLFAGASIARELPLRGVSLEAGVEHYRRWGRAGELSDASDESRLLVQLGFDL